MPTVISSGLQTGKNVQELQAKNRIPTSSNSKLNTQKSLRYDVVAIDINNCSIGINCNEDVNKHTLATMSIGDTGGTAPDPLKADNLTLKSIHNPKFELLKQRISDFEELHNNIDIWAREAS